MMIFQLYIIVSGRVRRRLFQRKKERSISRNFFFRKRRQFSGDYHRIVDMEHTKRNTLPVFVGRKFSTFSELFSLGVGKLWFVR